MLNKREARLRATAAKEIGAAAWRVEEAMHHALYDRPGNARLFLKRAEVRLARAKQALLEWAQA